MVKWLWIVLVVFGLIAVGSGFFIFASDELLFDGDGMRKDIGSVFFGDDDTYDDVFSDGSGGGFGGGSAGGGGGGGGGSADIVLDDGCILRQVQYSLKDFGYGSECLDYDGLKCLKMKTNCSINAYNFDEGVDDAFEIKYYLINASKHLFDSVSIAGDVAAGSSKVFYTDFISEDANGVDEGLFCIFNMEIVPRKKIC
jgi:hypothetical protein